MIKNMSKLFRAKNGFTLVEVMVATLIGVTSLMAVGLMLTDSGAYSNKDNRSKIYALNALRDEMDTLRNTSFDSIVTGTFTSSTVPQLSRLPNGTGSVTVTSGASFGMGADIKKVTVAVSWTNSKGVAVTNSITTMMTRTGINGA